MRYFISAALVLTGFGYAGAQTLEELEQFDRERAQAPSWIPPDSDPIGEYNNGKDRAIAYQFRIEFFKGTATKPSKTLRFRDRVFVEPHPVQLEEGGNRLLLCTNRLGGYSARNQLEERMLLYRGYQRGPMPWKNPKGTIGDFCGVVDYAGKTIFEFPKEDHPRRVYHIAGMVNGGKRAAVLVGEITEATGEEGEDVESGPTIGKFREIWIWDGKDLKKYPVTKAELNGNLRQRLRGDKW